MTLGPWISKFWYRYHYSSKQYTKYAFRMHSIFGGGPRSLYKLKTGKSIDIFGSNWGSFHNYAFSNPKLRLKAPVWLDKYFPWFVSYSDPKEHHYQYVLLIFSIQKHSHLKKFFYKITKSRVSSWDSYSYPFLFIWGNLCGTNG